MQDDWSALDCAAYWGRVDVVNAMIHHIREGGASAFPAAANIFESAYRRAEERHSREDRKEVMALIASATGSMPSTH